MTCLWPGPSVWIGVSGHSRGMGPRGPGGRLPPRRGTCPSLGGGGGGCPGLRGAKGDVPPGGLAGRRLVQGGQPPPPPPRSAPGQGTPGFRLWGGGVHKAHENWGGGQGLALIFIPAEGGGGLPPWTPPPPPLKQVPWGGVIRERASIDRTINQLNAGVEGAESFVEH